VTDKYIVFHWIYFYQQDTNKIEANAIWFTFLCTRLRSNSRTTN